jgi:hypothetical protein
MVLKTKSFPSKNLLRWQSVWKLQEEEVEDGAHGGGKQGGVQGVPNARRRKFSKVKVESAEEEAYSLENSSGRTKWRIRRRRRWIGSFLAFFLSI